MQDKFIAMDDVIIEDLGEEIETEAQPSPAASVVPVIEVTHFDESDHPAGTYRRPLHSFL